MTKSKNEIFGKKLNSILKKKLDCFNSYQILENSSLLKVNQFEKIIFQNF